MKFYLFVLFINITTLSLSAQHNDSIKKIAQDIIIEEFYTNCADKYKFTNPKRQECLDSGLAKDSTIAYLWQQKAMPYFKARKYEVGMKFIDKAVKYDSKQWQPYRAFIKCIFAKTYEDAIIDFEDCIKKYGNGYRMDHTYKFYISLCYLQLNNFKKAEDLIKEYIDDIFKNRQGLEHPTAFFYFGISNYEQEKYQEAINAFDKALKIYPQFSDAQYYKAICLSRIGQHENAKNLMKESKDNYLKNYTINEDNTIYETYPYQVTNR